MTSGVKPWTRQLDLCDRWLEIIIEEIKLRSHEISPTEVNGSAAHIFPSY
jgi:hypothetical protein